MKSNVNLCGSYAGEKSVNRTREMAESTSVAFRGVSTPVERTSRVGSRRGMGEWGCGKTYSRKLELTPKMM